MSGTYGMYIKKPFKPREVYIKKPFKPRGWVRVGR
jgi:hypothetical protein